MKIGLNRKLMIYIHTKSKSSQTVKKIEKNGLVGFIWPITMVYFYSALGPLIQKYFMSR